MGSKEKEKQVTVSVTLEIVLTQEDIDDIMCGALEGGITYWCDEAKVVGDYLGEYGSEQIARGGKLRLHLPEPFDKDETEYYELDRSGEVQDFGENGRRDCKRLEGGKG